MTSLIAAPSAIISPLVVHYVKKHFDERNLSSKRIKDVRGSWSGLLVQDTANGPLEMKIRAQFQASGKNIHGRIHSYDSELDVDIIFEGRFPHDDFVVLDYESIHFPTIKQFGAATLKLNAMSNNLTGRYAGHGHYTDDIVTGQLMLERIPDR